MKKSKIYLDTSVINFLFAEDAPEKKEATHDLFDNFIKTRVYETYVSDFVLQEIEQTTDQDKKTRLIETIDKYFIDLVELTDFTEINQLASAYLESAIPKNKLFDALHIACAVVNSIDYLVSWNYKHLANVNREKKIISINLSKNYSQPFRIITPFELLDYGN